MAKLDNHLIVKTRPIANKANVVYFGNYRITVLSDRLFRVEKDDTLKFCDSATQSVWYRDFAPVDFKVKKFADKVEVTTSKVKLVINLDYAKSYVVLDGKKKKLSNQGNLLGTYRTLDGYSGEYDTYSNPEENNGKFKKVQLCDGVVSKTGVAILKDNHTLILGEDGMLKPRPFEEIDDYVFAFGFDFKGAVKALYDITGYVPKIPRYALGNWWSRYHAYTDKEYLSLLDKFEENDIPLTIATIDMDWHYSDYAYEELKIDETGHRDEKYGCGTTYARGLGWTGYSWNKNLFPDYKAFLNKIKEKNLKITLNLHPKDGVRYFEDMYKDMCEAMGQDASEERPVEFNLTDENFINNYFKILHKPYENDGVTFWWIDWQQGTKSQMAGLDPLWALNHYHYLDNAVNHDQGLILSRFCEAGSHRYPLGFSADTSITYSTLNYLPYFTATASNIGYSWWSHDIGGHHHGYSDNELFLRSVQHGIFSPIMRLHSTAMISVTKEPWTYMGGTNELIGNALRYRHALIPFLYSEGVKNHKFGKAITEPLYYYYPENKLAYKYKNEYFFGDLLINPITTKSVYKGVSKVKGWIPEGTWTDIFTGQTYTAGKDGKEVTFYRFQNSIPALAKAGSVLPLSGVQHTNDCSNPKNLVLEVYSGNGTYDLYEDAGVKECVTNIKNVSDGVTLTTTISFDGDKSALPQNRNITVKFKNVYGGCPVVLKDGKPIDVSVKETSYVQCTINDVDYDSVYVITIKETVLDAVKKGQRIADDLMQKFEMNNCYKEDIYRAIQNNYWDHDVGCLLPLKEPLFDGTKASLYKIKDTVKFSAHEKMLHDAANDTYKEELVINKVYLEMLAECLDD